MDSMVTFQNNLVVQNLRFRESTEGCTECSCTAEHHNGVVYDTLLLIFCFLGIIFNWMSLLVLANKERKLAIFTYLTVYTTMDLLYTLILSAFVIAEFYFRHTIIFKVMELLDNFCTEVLNTVRIIAMLSITVDRIIHLEMVLTLKNPERQTSQTRARLVMIVTIVLCICANLPNLLIYKCQDVFLDPNFEYLRSQFYFSYNWIYFPLFYLLPCFLLITGNVRLISLLKIALKREHLIAKKGRKRNFNLTITAVVIIITFVIVQIPGYLTERSHFVSMVPSKFREDVLKIFSTIIKTYAFVPALNSFSNFFIYILLCPPFKRALVKTLMDQRRKCGIRSSSSSVESPETNMRDVS